MMVLWPQREKKADLAKVGFKTSPISYMVGAPNRLGAGAIANS